MQYNYRIKELLNKKKMTQQQLAEIVDITPTSLSRYFKGTQEPKLSVIVKIANALDVSIDYLLGLDAQSSTSSKNRLSNNENYKLYYTIVTQLGDLTNDQLNKIVDYISYVTLTNMIDD